MWKAETLRLASRRNEQRSAANMCRPDFYETNAIFKKADRGVSV